MNHLREKDLVKRPGISETLDWAEALIKLNVHVLDAATVEQTLGCILKIREDIRYFSEEIWSDPALRDALLGACGGRPG